MLSVGCFQSLVSYTQMFSGFALSNSLLLPPSCAIPLTKIRVMAFNVFPGCRLCPPRLLPPLLLPWFLHGSLGPSYLMSHHDLTDSPHCHGGYLPKVQLSWRNLRIKSNFSAWSMENDLMYDLSCRMFHECLRRIYLVIWLEVAKLIDGEFPVLGQRGPFFRLYIIVLNVVWLLKSLPVLKIGICCA